MIPNWTNEEEAKAKDLYAKVFADSDIPQDSDKVRPEFKEKIMDACRMEISLERNTATN